MELTGAAARSIEQRQEALARANEVRFARAKLRKDIASRRRNPIRVLQDLPEYAEGMPAEKLLTAVPGLGANKIYRLLRACDISPMKPLGDLTARQRRVLARELKEKIWTR